ncbi:MAG: DNA mismatch repair protein MutS [Vicingaceae bacterium]|nr:DNA mismatch repair protein MutS [Vicingaceae bacterium]
MFYFDEKTATDLEFDQIKVWLTEACQTETVESRVQKLQPLRDQKKVEESLNLTHDLQLIRNRGVQFPRLTLEELKKELKLLSISGSVLQIKSLIKLLDASLMVNELFLFFKEHKENYEHLQSLMGQAYYTTAIEKEMDKVLDKHLKIKDDASEALKSIRQGMQSCRKQINRNFDRALRSALNNGYIDPTKESVIDNRRVLTVLSSYKREVQGRVMGGSKTGSLTYIEPQVNRALNFELDQLIDDERKEIQRILAELSEFFRSQYELLLEYQKIVYAFDEVNAKEKLARKIDGVKPQLNLKNQDTFLKEAYHPILLVKNVAAKLKTIPQTFELKKENRLLVISGPNAGGKSITLKTMGLLQLMFQSGLMVSVNPKSKMAFFDYILSDIGDNQSIENELSTYSYRLQRMNFFLKKTSPKTLLLLDEFGTGSDPDLGGALAEVFFETIYKDGCFGVITTHYSNIKLKASELPEAVNANMLFNRTTLSPEFQLSMGQPGSSFTFEVAQKNGIPKDMIEQAKTKVDGQKIHFDQLISDLQREKSVLQKLKKESYQSKQLMDETKEAFERKRIHFEELLETQQKRIERNDKYLSQGQKMHHFIESYPSKAKGKQPAFLKEVKKYITMEKSKREAALKKLNEANEVKKAAQKSKAKQQQNKPSKSKKPEKPIEVGLKVKLKTGKQVGEVISIDGNDAKVVFGNLTAKVKVKELRVV